MITDEIVKAMEQMIEETDNADERAGMIKMMEMLCEREWSR